MAPAFARPYTAAFWSRFQLMLQYRAAALAGFTTQCWWGGIKVMVFTAFYQASPTAATPVTLAQVITYTWVAQGLLALLPWTGDPDVALAVRTGAVSHDRLRPVDAYALWFARAAGWITARALPRVALMFVFAAIVLPLLDLDAWAWQLPPDVWSAAAFAVSLVLAVLLSSAVIMLINVVVVRSLHERGVNTLVMPLVVALSGNLLPLVLFPAWMQTALLLQPLAGVLDIPLRLYLGQLHGQDALLGLGLQAGWTVALVLAGRAGLAHAMSRLEIQGG